jgi:hypothetical protein
MTSLVTVSVFPARIEADLARGALEAAGIYSVISADDAGQQNPGLVYSSGVAVLVRAEDLASARQILNEDPGPESQPSRT